MELMDPTGTTPDHEHHMAPRLASVDGLRIGLLTNGKVNADVLIKETAELFRRRNGCTVAELIDKRDASRPAPEGMLAEIAADCDLLLTAVGD